MTGQYFMPGGLVDPGEDPYTAAARELREETGLEFSGPMTMVGCYPMWIYGQNMLRLIFRGPVVGEVVQRVADLLRSIGEDLDRYLALRSGG